MSKRNIFLYETSRSLLIYLLFAHNLKGRNIFITTKKGNDDIFKRLIGLKIVLKGDLNNSEKQEEYNEVYRKYGWLIFRKLRRGIAKGEIGLYGLAHEFLGGVLFARDKLNLVEDGLMDLKPKVAKKNIKYRFNHFFNIFCRRDRNWWRHKSWVDPNIKNIIITSATFAKGAKVLKYNPIVMDLNTAWEQKSEAEKEYILNVFAVDREYVKNIEKNGFWLYTQPLSEDGLISEEEKIELYGKIIGKYDKEKIIIKPHPREKTDYAQHFPDIKVLKANYPMELLMFLGVQPKKAITLFSTAVFLLPEGIEIDFYGTEVDEKLYNWFGSMDEIFKRNAFLS